MRKPLIAHLLAGLVIGLVISMPAAAQGYSAGNEAYDPRVADYAKDFQTVMRRQAEIDAMLMSRGQPPRQWPARVPVEEYARLLHAQDANPAGAQVYRQQAKQSMEQARAVMKEQREQQQRQKALQPK